MFFVYEVPNMNPALGSITNNQQSVSVYDRDLGNRRTVITTPEEADAFIDTRKQVINSAANRGWGLAGLVTAAGAAIGAGVNRYFDVKSAKKLDALIDPLNQVLSDAIASGKTLFSAKFDALRKDAFKKFSFELGELFSEDAKMFKHVDIKSIAKHAMKTGAIGGALLAACFAFSIPFVKANNADKKITQEFIELNK